MSDDGFHEIQLNGKQLVFLFMATTVVSVVIFLCGVLVGRGVRAERASEAALAEVDGSAIAPSVPAAGESAPPASRPEGDTYTYADRLENAGPPVEELKVAEAAPPVVSEPEPPAPAPPAPPAPSPRPSAGGAVAPAPAARPAAPPAPAATTGPPGTFTVQVAALGERGEAEAVVKRLTSKGFAAYVVDPAPTAPRPIYRVRVGHFTDRREAEQMVKRLETEGQFKPWITR